MIKAIIYQILTMSLVLEMILHVLPDAQVLLLSLFLIRKLSLKKMKLPPDLISVKEQSWELNL